MTGQIVPWAAGRAGAAAAVGIGSWMVAAAACVLYKLVAGRLRVKRPSTRSARREDVRNGLRVIRGAKA